MSKEGAGRGGKGAPQPKWMRAWQQIKARIDTAMYKDRHGPPRSKGVQARAPPQETNARFKMHRSGQSDCLQQHIHRAPEP